MPSSRLVVVLGVALAAGLAAFVVSRRLPTPPPENSTATVSSSPAASAKTDASPPRAAWPENPVTYDCTELAPPNAAPEAKASDDPASKLIRKAHWYGASAVLCGAGLVVTRDDAADLERCLTGAAAQTLSPFARAVVQNAAMKVARCARAATAPGTEPGDAQLTALRAHAKQLARRLALDAASLSALDATPDSALASWLGMETDAAKIPTAPTTSFHSRATGNTLAMRALPSVRGADVTYGKLVVVDTHGDAHVLNAAAQLVFRKTTDRGLTVCIAELADPIATTTPALRPAALSVADLGAVRCDRCHQRGRQVAQEPGTPGGTDRALLDDVSAWYRSSER